MCIAVSVADCVKSYCRVAADVAVLQVRGASKAGCSPRLQPVCAVLSCRWHGAKNVLAPADRHGQHHGYRFSRARSGEPMPENQLFAQTPLAATGAGLPDGVQLRRFEQADLEAAQTLSAAFQWPH